MPPYPYTEWAAEQLRLTAFLLPGTADPPLERWWEEAIGGAPDESTSNAKTGVRTLSGAFNDQKLVLKLEPGRVDWLFTPQGRDTAIPQSAAAMFTGEIPSIGSITESLQLFSRIAEQWLVRSDVPELIRLAFGEVVWHPEEDRRSAYVRIPEYIPLRLGPDATDFNFQVNLPTASRTGVDGLRINRLTRWSVMGLVRVTFQIDLSTATSTQPQLMAHALRLELDVNTTPDFRGPLPRVRLVDIYRELVAFARTIVTEGLRQ